MRFFIALSEGENAVETVGGICNPKKYLPSDGIGVGAVFPGPPSPARGRSSGEPANRRGTRVGGWLQHNA